MNYASWFGSGFGMMGASWLAPFAPFFIIILIWSLAWKGLALWRAAKRDDTIWFIIFLVVNTLGILEIIYLFAIAGAKVSDFTGPLTRKK